MRYSIEHGLYVCGLAGDQLNLQPRYQANSVGHSIACCIPTAWALGPAADPLAPAGYKGDPFGAAELNAYCTAAIMFKVPTGSGGYSDKDLQDAKKVAANIVSRSR